MTKTEQIARARAIADELRAAWPEKAAEIDALIAQAEAGKRDGVNVSVKMKYRLEKFEGAIEPNKAPYAVIEGQG